MKIRDGLWQRPVKRKTKWEQSVLFLELTLSKVNIGILRMDCYQQYLSKQFYILITILDCKFCLKSEQDYGHMVIFTA